MKYSIPIQRLNQEADRFQAKAKDLALTALHKAQYESAIDPRDARLIRDHELRAETFRAAAALISEPTA